MTLQIPTIVEPDTHGSPADVGEVPFGLAFHAFVAYLDRRRPHVSEAAAEAVLEDLNVLFAEAAADGTPLRAVVGEDPAEVAEALLANHAEEDGNAAARADLAAAIAALA